MKYEVVVELKPEVLDTQGRAIQEALHRLGHKGLKSVKVAKRFVLEIEGSETEAQVLVQKLAEEHLASSVAETYRMQRL